MLDLRALVRAREDGLAQLSRHLQSFIDAGRLPYDLAVLVYRDVAKDRAGETAPAETAPNDGVETDDAAAEAGQPEPGARAAGGDAPAADTDEELRRKVDSVVLQALVGQYRDRRQADAGRAPTPQRHLDAALAAFRGVRTRHDARKAASGEARAYPVAEASPERNMIGHMLRDRFVLDKELGRGGMGVVYRAVDRRRLEAQARRPYVALKLLAGDFRTHPDALRAMEAEARRTQDLPHPNIVAVHDFDRDGDHVFMVMELLEGRSLDVALKDPNPGFVGSPAAHRAVGELCAGLALAHARGVVHADLKPANLFLCIDGTLKILDFGISCAARDDGGFDGSRLDAMTPVYASPERLRGARRDPRDDVYALGCLIHLMMTGHHPFGRATALDALAKGMAPAPLPLLRPQEQAAVRDALAFAPEDRLADAQAFLRASNWQSGSLP
ncbi:serine/threonine-protein kinase [Ancylobacter amanitiformis]|uniref:tRNA A-37 threonylcarbamoyl transferase component Bud32 n=1 Tax=Ancylobacter amanitiformis TaxID=217069 RepID=A0ABU0LLC5_9HYPH|nr:serine/threonine-protein kinase [Ancylobacter amanitiformis]MDQ0509459.1 tRNA A-37 threonylcarbamoyl transferase component Bud32 [Ancylobacter amanitiformis]